MRFLVKFTVPAEKSGSVDISINMSSLRLLSLRSQGRSEERRRACPELVEGKNLHGVVASKGSKEILRSLWSLRMT
jgi:hypothetical protein